MPRKDYTKPSTLAENRVANKEHEEVTHVAEPKKKQKLFISLPMAGRDEKDILNDIQKISNKFKENYDIIDSYHQEEDPNGVDRYSSVWYLGHSIQLMRTANLVVFSKNWPVARGCIIEHRICEYYDIPFIELRYA